MKRIQKICIILSFAFFYVILQTHSSPSLIHAIEGDIIVTVSGSANDTNVFSPGETANISVTGTPTQIGGSTLVTAAVPIDSVSGSSYATISTSTCGPESGYYAICERPVAPGASVTFANILTVRIRDNAPDGAIISIPVTLSDEIPETSGSRVTKVVEIRVSSSITPPPAASCSTTYTDARCVAGVTNSQGNIGCPSNLPSLVVNPSTSCTGGLLCCSASAPTTCESVTGAVCVEPDDGGCPSSSNVPRSPAPYECDGTKICCRTIDITATSECQSNYGTTHGARCLESCNIAQGWYALDLPGNSCELESLICCSRYNSDFFDFQDKTTCVSVAGRGIATAIGCVPILENIIAFSSYILTWAAGVAGGVSVLLISYAGFLIMTSKGDSEKIKAGKELVTATITGLVFLVLAALILRIMGSDVLQIFS